MSGDLEFLLAFVGVVETVSGLSTIERVVKSHGPLRDGRNRTGNDRELGGRFTKRTYCRWGLGGGGDCPDGEQDVPLALFEDEPAFCAWLGAADDSNVALASAPRRVTCADVLNALSSVDIPTQTSRRNVTRGDAVPRGLVLGAVNARGSVPTTGRDLEFRYDFLI